MTALFLSNRKSCACATHVIVIAPRRAVSEMNGGEEANLPDKLIDADKLIKKI
jgi:hypothetical protein